jgi:hypothetical protein
VWSRSGRGVRMRVLSRRRSSGTVSAMSCSFRLQSPPFRGGAGGGQMGVVEHRQGDVPVPGGVVTDLIGGQPGLVLGGLEALLDGPPGAGHGDELLEGGAGGAGADVKASSAASSAVWGMVRRANTQRGHPGSNPASNSMRAQS